MGADVAVINKKDLAQAMGVDVEKLKMDVKEINPNAKVVATNCRSGEGIMEVVRALGL
jgi:Ni2+-binding GTPase involved in maturation of urease and hydrogenase